MNRLIVLALLALACLAVTGTASASTSSIRCVYKTTKLPVYMQITGVLTTDICDIVGRSAGGTAVKVYTSPAGSPWCAFNIGYGVKMTVYSPNSLYGSTACRSFSGHGFKRIF